MVYDQLRQTATQDFVLRCKTGNRRTIITPYGSDRGAPDRVLTIEHEILDKLDLARQEFRQSSLFASGVRLHYGTSSDYIIVNEFSKTNKAFLHAVAFPELADAEFAQQLCQADSKIEYLFLVSESVCLEVTTPIVCGVQKDLKVKVVLENTGSDFYGCVVDYFRKKFVEGMRVFRPLRFFSPPNQE